MMRDARFISMLLTLGLVSSLAACGGGGGGGGSGGSGASAGNGGTATAVALGTFQLAEVVVGQADFQGTDANRGGSVAANTVSGPYGNAGYGNGVLYLGDYDNDRVLGYNGLPTMNGAGADFVLGQADFTSTDSSAEADGMGGPQTTQVAGGKLFLADYGNNRVVIYHSAPTSGPGTGDVVLGQSDFGQSDDACSATGMSEPETLAVAGSKLIVTDSGNNRVLIWNSIPTTSGVAPDLVLGQSDLTSCDSDQGGVASATGMNYPAGVWSDGTRLVVIDNDNNRALIWNTFPTSNDQPADLVLGQADFTHVAANDDDQDGKPTARTLNAPYDGVDSDGTHLAIADSGNNRVLIWDTFPTSNFQPADRVLGQSDFSHFLENDDDQDGSSDSQASARTLNQPSGVRYIPGKALVVTDEGNSRYLIFSAVP